MGKTKFKWWALLVLTLAFFALVIIFPKNPAHELFLRYLSIITSWQFIILVLILTFLLKFRDSISSFLRNPLKTISIPGKFELHTQTEGEPLDSGKTEELLRHYDTELASAKQISSTLLQAVIFERDIRHMYRSQFNLLALLNINKTANSKVPKSIIESIFYRDLYLKRGGNPAYSFESYLAWLMNLGYLTIGKIGDAEVAEITPRGEQFISYCTYWKYTENEFMPL